MCLQIQPTTIPAGIFSEHAPIRYKVIFLRHDPREVGHCQKAGFQEHNLDVVLRIAMFLSSRETGKEKKNQCAVNPGSQVVTLRSSIIILAHCTFELFDRVRNLASLGSIRVDDGHGCIIWLCTQDRHVMHMVMHDNVNDWLLRYPGTGTVQLY